MLWNLNYKTITNKYPIPNIRDILDNLDRCNYYKPLDLASGFHQIEFNEKDTPKTAFNIEYVHVVTPIILSIIIINVIMKKIEKI